jgi:hypothetical protein
VSHDRTAWAHNVWLRDDHHIGRNEVGVCWALLEIRGVIRPGEKSQADEQSRLEALRSVLRSARLQAGSGETTPYGRGAA